MARREIKFMSFPMGLALSTLCLVKPQGLFDLVSKFGISHQIGCEAGPRTRLFPLALISANLSVCRVSLPATYCQPLVPRRDRYTHAQGAGSSSGQQTSRDSTGTRHHLAQHPVPKNGPAVRPCLLPSIHLRSGALTERIKTRSLAFPKRQAPVLVLETSAELV